VSGCNRLATRLFYKACPSQGLMSWWQTQSGGAAFKED